MAAIGVPEEEQPKPDAKAKSPAKKPDPATKTKTAPSSAATEEYQRNNTYTGFDNSAAT